MDRRVRDQIVGRCPREKSAVGYPLGAAPRRAFTLLDVLVSIAVIAVLIGLLMPGLNHVNQRARRVMCSSNVRQIGLGIQMYADSNSGYLVPSIYVSGWDKNSMSQPQEMIRLKLDDHGRGLWGSDWDGLGRLYSGDYLNAEKIFYCSSHHGEHPYERYADRFGQNDRGGICGNYQYRGVSPNGSRFLDAVDPKQTAIVCDGIRAKADYNHSIGMNVLRADQSVDWFDDSSKEFYQSLPDDPSTSWLIQEAWETLDATNSQR